MPARYENMKDGRRNSKKEQTITRILVIIKTIVIIIMRTIMNITIIAIE